MKVIIAGSRTVDWTEFIEMWSMIPHEIVNSITEVVSGAAKGPDKYGEIVANHNKLKVREFPAQWALYKKRSGIVRNMQMGDYADAALIFWDGSSRGSKHMQEYMEKLNKPVVLLTRNEDDKPSITYYGRWFPLPANE